MSRSLKCRSKTLVLSLAPGTLGGSLLTETSCRSCQSSKWFGTSHTMSSLLCSPSLRDTLVLPFTLLMAWLMSTEGPLVAGAFPLLTCTRLRSPSCSSFSCSSSSCHLSSASGCSRRMLEMQLCNYHCACSPNLHLEKGQVHPLQHRYPGCQVMDLAYRYGWYHWLL